MTTFVEARLAEAPPYLRGPEGEALATVLGAEQDAEVARLRVAAMSGSPSRCPDDALDAVGTRYRILRAPWETAASYRVRLEGGIAFWEIAPRPAGLAMIFDPLNPNGELTIYSDTDLVWDSNHNQVGRVWGIWDKELIADYAWDGGTIGTYDDGGLWDVVYVPGSELGFGVPHLDYLKRQIRIAKGASAYPVFVFVGLTTDDTDDTGPFWDSLGGIWDNPDFPGELWDSWALADADGNPLTTVLVLGHVWEEHEILGGGPGCWDADDGAKWEGFEPPSGGWT